MDCQNLVTSLVRTMGAWIYLFLEPRQLGIKPRGECNRPDSNLDVFISQIEDKPEDDQLFSITAENFGENIKITSLTILVK